MLTLLILLCICFSFICLWIKKQVNNDIWYRFPLLSYKIDFLSNNFSQEWEDCLETLFGQLPSLISVIDHYDVDWIPHQTPSKDSLYSASPAPNTRNALWAHFSISFKCNSQFLTWQNLEKDNFQLKAFWLPQKKPPAAMYKLYREGMPFGSLMCPKCLDQGVVHRHWILILFMFGT